MSLLPIDGAETRTVAPPIAATPRAYVLVMLTLVYIMNMIDRKIVTILQEPIKHEFGLMDWQLGLMSGFAFATLYAVAGFPIARYADRPTSNRVNIISGALVAWSAATALGGIAQNYIQLLLARFAVGIGEAGSGPPSHSIIADLFRLSERGRAMGLFALASPIGIAAGLSIGGYVADHFSWRVALLLVGLPGLLLALVFRATVIEPRRSQAVGQARPADRPGFLETLRTIGRKRTFQLLVTGGCLAAFTNLGIQYWYPTFFMRSFGLTLGEVGLAWGVASGTAGVVGTFGGGWLADKFGKNNPRAILLVPACGMVLALPFHIAAVTAAEWHVALALLLVPTTLTTLWVAPNMTLNQGLAPLAMRATIVALSTFLVNLVGLGLGPMGLGYLSDVFTSSYGSTEAGLRIALIAISPVYLLSGLCFFAGSFFIPRDLEDTAVAVKPAS
ncbi:MFS transporter [Sphingosinicella ginsenosidimutans]